MSTLETNVFPITNLQTLSSPYRLYRIRGIRPDDPEYHQNLQTLVRKLSYSLRSPVTSIIHDGEPRLVIRDDAANPPSPFPLVRATAYLDRLSETYTLDYTKSTEETDPIRLRFVQFMLQAPLSSNPQLWQPGSGEPFFEKTAAETFGQISRFAGFAVRAVLMPDGRIGLCVDVKNKFLGTKPLPAHTMRDQFRRWKGRHFIYHYGHQWYDVQAHELSDLNVTELLVRRDGEFVSLLQFIVDASRKPIPQELAQLPHDAAVLHYQNNTGESRAAPLGLCYPVFDTQEPEVQRYHHTTILKPHERREMIQRSCAALSRTFASAINRSLFPPTRFKCRGKCSRCRTIGSVEIRSSPFAVRRVRSRQRWRRSVACGPRCFVTRMSAFIRRTRSNVNISFFRKVSPTVGAASTSAICAEQWTICFPRSTRSIPSSFHTTTGSPALLSNKVPPSSMLPNITAPRAGSPQSWCITSSRPLASTISLPPWWSAKCESLMCGPR